MSAVGLLFGQDMAVSQWTWGKFNIVPSAVQCAIGIVRNNQNVGSVMFHEYSGYNIELSYYGPFTLTAGIVRTLARFVIERYNIERVTVRTNRNNTKLMRNLGRLGFKFEGVQKRFYGPFGDAAAFVMFREDIERLGRL